MATKAPALGFSLPHVHAASHARTHEREHETKPKAISWYGTLADSSPQPPILDLVLLGQCREQLVGVGVERLATAGRNEAKVMEHRSKTTLTMSCRSQNGPTTNESCHDIRLEKFDAHHSKPKLFLPACAYCQPSPILQEMWE